MFLKEPAWEPSFTWTLSFPYKSQPAQLGTFKQS